jgi:uncharacterized protein with PQ loop repeat
MGQVLDLVLPAAMTVAPVAGYIPQYQSIKKTKNAAGFSTFVSLILFISNILRLFFWIGKRFELYLVFQSIFMIIAQLFMMNACVSAAQADGKRRKRFIEFDPSSFWNWRSFSDYVEFLASFAAIMAFFTLIFLFQNWFTEVLGFLALGIESVLGVPQLLQNYKKRSTEGLSWTMIASWFIGDFVKTILFIQRGAPMQFTLCGIVQLTVDILICYQIYAYTKPKNRFD